MHVYISHSQTLSDTLSLLTADFQNIAAAVVSGGGAAAASAYATTTVRTINIPQTTKYTIWYVFFRFDSIQLNHISWPERSQKLISLSHTLFITYNFSVNFNLVSISVDFLGFISTLCLVFPWIYNGITNFIYRWISWLLIVNIWKYSKYKLKLNIDILVDRFTF